MFDALRRLIGAPTNQTDVLDTKLAVAALLVHLSAVDGVITDDERETIHDILADQFELADDDVQNLIREATREDAEAVDLYKFTSTLSGLSEEMRENIIRMMWQLTFADRQMHELEDNMVWRVAELIGISTRKRAILRNQMKKGRT